MPPRRVRPPARPVTLTLDGARIVGDAEGSIASALLGAGHLQLARSPKFHRPRGPACMRAGCDGCLMRIDGVPNVMACALAAREGARVERQNVVLTSRIDVLRATDWFFPQGMNHHEMFAGVPGIQGVMQAFARRVSGLGELPEDVVRPAALGEGHIEARRCDVLVVGAGPAGLAAATAIALGGARVFLVDEQRTPGGCLLYFPTRACPRFPSSRGTGAATGASDTSSADEHADVDERIARLTEGAVSAGVTMLLRTTIIGVLEGGDWLADDSQTVTRIEARAHVVAPGGHDGPPMFAGNELPGVVSARAAGRLLREGVLIGERALVVGAGPYADAFADAALAEGGRVERVVAGEITSARGLSRVRSAALVDPAGRERRVDCDAIVVDLPPAPAFEVAVQAGAHVVHGSAGYAVVVDDKGRAHGGSSGASAERSWGASAALPASAPSPGPRGTTFALGEVTGEALDPHAFWARAETIAQAVLADIGGAG